MEESALFGSAEYIFSLALLLFSRGADFLSTWVATPKLVLEGNPIAKRMGWKVGIFLNLALCVTFGFYPFFAILISTTSILLAAHNFQHAWIIRTLGEEVYRDWFIQRLMEAHMGLYLFCLLAQTGLFALLGAALVYFSYHLVPAAIGLGVIAYAMTVLFYTLLSVWRIRR